jgi:hypothetical protein
MLKIYIPTFLPMFNFWFLLTFRFQILQQMRSLYYKMSTWCSFCCLYMGITILPSLKAIDIAYLFTSFKFFIRYRRQYRHPVMTLKISLSPLIYMRVGGKPCSANFSFTIHQTAKNVNDFDLLQPLKGVLSEWLRGRGSLIPLT